MTERTATVSRSVSASLARPHPIHGTVPAERAEVDRAAKRQANTEWARRARREGTMQRFKAMLGPSARTDWGTPQYLFDALNRQFHFTLDAAASADNAKCAKFYDREADGTVQSWKMERVWCNPPYGRQAIVPFVRKAATMEADLAVLLVPARTDTGWWHDHIANRATVWFLKHRFKFVGATDGCPFGVAVAIYSPANVPITRYVHIPKPKAGGHDGESSLFTAERAAT
jgi:site-specific DNA-methyltransferase (adenine-specific)